MRGEAVGGDLTDVKTWERAWQRRAPLRTTPRRSWFYENHRDLLQAVFSAALATTRPPLSVLEIGCAPGKKLREMFMFAPEHKYSGVDFAPDALERTRVLLDDLHMQASLHLADVRAFEPEEPYDLVVSFGLIEHFEAPLAMVHEHVRLVRPGGVVGVMIPNYAHPFVRYALSIYSPRTLDSHNLHTMSTTALAGYLRDAGLGEVSTGSYGGSLMPVGNIEPGRIGKSLRWLVTGWNVAARAMPRSLSPWQMFLWAHGRKPM